MPEQQQLPPPPIDPTAPMTWWEWTVAAFLVSLSLLPFVYITYLALRVLYLILR